MFGAKSQETTTKSSVPRAGVAQAGGSPEPGRSVIASDLSIEGNCEAKGFLRVEGRIVGDVRAGTIEIAESGSIRGNVRSTGGDGSKRPFVIGGQVSGRVEAPFVRVDPTGIVGGGVVCRQADVRGTVEGGVVGRERIAVGGTAVVEGELRTLRLAFEEGGQLNGSVVMSEDRSDRSEPIS